MANDTYTVNAQGRVAAGRFITPSWVRNQSVNTWGTIPSSNTLADLNPRNNPDINPNFPNKAEWEALGSFTAIINAWCGACNNDDEIWIPLPAGHADYAGAEPYRLRFKQDAPAWEMVHPPTGALPDAIVTNDGQEASGLYGDGRPRAVHSYNKAIWIPNRGPAVIPQGSTSHSGQNGTLRPVILNANTGEMDLFGADIGVGSSGDYSGGCTAWDSLRGRVWARRKGTGRFHSYDPATNTWQLDVSDSIAVSGDTAAVYLPTHDCIVWLCATFAASNQVAVIDCATGQQTLKTYTGSPVGMTLNGSCQPRVMAPNQLACWNNSSSTTQINVLSFDTDPITGSWSVSQLPVAAENTVTPTAAASNGTFGRFFVSESLGILGTINAVDQPIYFYRYK